MRYLSVAQALVLSLLAVTSIAAEVGNEAAAQDLSKRYVGGYAAAAANVARAAASSLDSRHHTEAQIAAKKAKAAKEAKAKAHGRDAPEADEFGPWDSTEDEFGSWVKRDVEAREPHHTEAQIAAKKAKEAKEAKKKTHGRDVPEPDEFGPWDSTEDEFGSWEKRDIETREPHHTEAQIAAKKAKAAESEKGKVACRDVDIETRDPHHTEAQIAAKKAKAASASKGAKGACK